MLKQVFAGLSLALSPIVSTLSLSADAAPSRFESGSLQVEKLGSKGRAVILIPGLASGSWVWRDTAPRLSKDHVVYLLTLPGFDGRPARADATLESVQADLLALIEKQKIEKPALVGHSLGAAMSLAFATKHSAKIAGVVAVDGLPVFPGTERTTDRKPLAESMRTQFAGQTREQFLTAQQTYMRNIGVIDEKLADELATLAARSDVGATASFAAEVMALDLRPQLGAIKVPVVSVSPFHAPDFARIGVDEAGKTGYYRWLLAGVEKLDVVSISPARHFVMFDQPEKFAVALDQVLANMFESPTK